MGISHGRKCLQTDNCKQNLYTGCSQPLIGPDPGSEMGSDQNWDRGEALDQNQLLLQQTDDGYYEELIRPKKLPNPVKSSRSHQELHRELLITHKRGMLMEEKHELQRVLEERRRTQALRREQNDEKEVKKMQSSPLEEELLRRHQRLEKLERDLEEERERVKRLPEFVKVRESLKRTAVVNTMKKVS